MQAKQNVNAETGCRPGSTADKAIRAILTDGGMYENVLADAIDIPINEAQAMLAYPVREAYLSCTEREFGRWYDRGPRRPGAPHPNPAPAPAPRAAVAPAPRVGSAKAHTPPDSHPWKRDLIGTNDALPPRDTAPAVGEVAPMAIPQFGEAEARVVAAAPAAAGPRTTGRGHVAAPAPAQAEDEAQVAALREVLMDPEPMAVQTTEPQVDLHALAKAAGQAEPRPKEPDPAAMHSALIALSKRLTNSEFRVFQCLVAGWSHERIKKELRLQLSTVQVYRNKILRRMCVKNDSGLIEIAKAAGVPLTVEEVLVLAADSPVISASRTERVPRVVESPAPQPIAPAPVDLEVIDGRRVRRVSDLEPMNCWLDLEGSYVIQVPGLELRLPKMHSIRLINYVDRLAPEH